MTLGRNGSKKQILRYVTRLKNEIFLSEREAQRDGLHKSCFISKDLVSLSDLCLKSVRRATNESND